MAETVGTRAFGFMAMRGEHDSQAFDDLKAKLNLFYANALRSGARTNVLLDPDKVEQYLDRKERERQA